MISDVFNSWLLSKFNIVSVIKPEPVREHGKGHSGFPRFRCIECLKSFQLDYVYEACKPDEKGKIVDMSMNSSGVRETVQVLNFAYNTVLSTLKNLDKVSNLNAFR
ncbi:hypothetical protein ACEI23_002234 [Vibrio alginolyticus]